MTDVVDDDTPQPHPRLTAGAFLDRVPVGPDMVADPPQARRRHPGERHDVRRVPHGCSQLGESLPLERLRLGQSPVAFGFVREWSIHLTH